MGKHDDWVSDLEYMDQALERMLQETKRQAVQISVADALNAVRKLTSLVTGRKKTLITKLGP